MLYLEISYYHLATLYTGWTEKDKVRVGEELSDVLIILVQLSDRCHVNLPAAVTRKLQLNAEKYPANKVYGSCLKYTAYDNN